MKAVFSLVAGLALAGCEYTVPLAPVPLEPIDRQLVGAWERAKEDGRKEGLLVLPLNAREYLVSFPAGASKAMFAKACLVPCAGRRLAQLEWFGTAEGKLPEDARVYQFAAWSLSGGALTVRMLNASVVDKEAKTPAALAASIEQNKDRTDLFAAPMVFTRKNPGP